MACGTPTLTSTVSCLPEVAGGAAVLVDPFSVDSIAEGLKQTLDQPDQLRPKGFARAAQFKWNEVAGDLLSLYKSIAL
jgi:glycosyltransferase involved in cell wall biosynthesis